MPEKNLKDDVYMVPRWVTIKTQEDFDRAYLELKLACQETECNKCRFVKTSSCYHSYMKELVEVHK